MDQPAVYYCTLCHTAASAIVAGLDDPDTLVSERSQKTLRDLAETKAKLGLVADADPVATLSAELLDGSVKRALLYATCPRCGQRNPEGVAEHAKSRRSGRVIGTLASVAVAVGVWFLPWVAYLVLAIVVGMTVLMFVHGARARTLRLGAIAYNLTFATVIVAVVWFYPRASALVPLILAVRFAISGGMSDYAWTNAKETIRFETPYR